MTDHEIPDSPQEIPDSPMETPSYPESIEPNPSNPTEPDYEPEPTD